MDAPGKGLLKVVSILFIIFGALFIIVAALSIIGTQMMNSPQFAAALPAGTDPSQFNNKALLATSIILLAGSILDVIFGIVGIKKCKDPAKADFFFYAGIVLCGLTVISLYLGIITTGFSFTSLVGFILPALFIIGSLRYRKAATV